MADLRHRRAQPSGSRRPADLPATERHSLAQVGYQAFFARHPVLSSVSGVDDDGAGEAWNGMLFIHDAGRMEPPDYQGAAFSFNDQCISIRAKHEQAGRGQVTLGPLSQVGLQRPADLIHPIKTKNRQVIITLVAGDPVVILPVSTDSIRLAIWLDDSNEAEKIVIGAEPG